MTEEREANAIAALKECVEAGVSWDALQTLRFEMGISWADLTAVIEGVLTKKFTQMREHEQIRQH